MEDALALGCDGSPVDIRIFAKPNTLKNRRMGVALARAGNVEAAKASAIDAANRIRIKYA